MVLTGYCTAAARAVPASRADDTGSSGRWEARQQPALSLGLLPALWLRELMMGIKMPPARAVVEGMAGAITASAMLQPWTSADAQSVK